MLVCVLARDSFEEILSKYEEERSAMEELIMAKYSSAAINQASSLIRHGELATLLPVQQLDTAVDTS